MKSRRGITKRAPRKTGRYLFVFGGVISGLGKGIAVASIARILQAKGFRVTAMKIDPYVNVDAGTMNPTEHGEVFVTKDGLETDQDIGNYERFLDTELTRLNYLTTGSVYLSLIERERNLEFGGKQVEVVPHVPNEVIRRIKLLEKKERAEIVIIEIGGTVGEYQNLLFLEAARMMHLRHPEHVQFILVSYLPIPSNLGEMKTKPTQYAVRTVNSAGMQPNVILARASQLLDAARRERLSFNTGVPAEDIISAPDVDSVYTVPVNFERERLGDKLLKNFGLAPRKRGLNEWMRFVKSVSRLQRSVRIGVVGKYFSSGDFTLIDSYISVIEAIKHAAWDVAMSPELVWIDAESLARGNLDVLKTIRGLIVPGGFGSRGVEGKLRAIRYAREKKLPYLGLCFGMQLAVVEFARTVLGLTRASSTELHPRTPDPVVDVMEKQKQYLSQKRYGGTMRLGNFRCRIRLGTHADAAYGERTVFERHRHRYELNNRYRDALAKHGMLVSGENPETALAEIIEIPNHPFFVGVQFHPEFRSRPQKPHPLFRALLAAAIKT